MNENCVRYRQYSMITYNEIEIVFANTNTAIIKAL